MVSSTKPVFLIWTDYSSYTYVYSARLRHSKNARTAGLFISGGEKTRIPVNIPNSHSYVRKKIIAQHLIIQRLKIHSDL